jgi:hypothetical protein
VLQIKAHAKERPSIRSSVRIYLRYLIVAAIMLTDDEAPE